MDDRYAAGLIDGEGCILIPRQVFSNHVRYHLRVTMAMAIPDALIEAQKEYGGSLCLATPPKNPRHRRTLSWTIVGNDAARLLRRVLPFLMVKADEARIGLEMHDGISRARGKFGKCNTDEEMDRREGLRRQLLERKHRHLDPTTLGMAANSGKGRNGQSRAKQAQSAPGVCND